MTFNSLKTLFTRFTASLFLKKYILININKVHFMSVEYNLFKKLVQCHDKVQLRENKSLFKEYAIT